MAIIKAYTSVEQSRRLVKILSHESADMYYRDWKRATEDIRIANVGTAGSSDLPCWSFAALMDILPDGTDIVKDKSDTENEHYMCTVGIKDDIISTFSKNPVDAAYNMILKLHELNLL